jgi:hypothetical protein
MPLLGYIPPDLFPNSTLVERDNGGTPKRLSLPNRPGNLGSLELSIRRIQKIAGCESHGRHRQVGQVKSPVKVSRLLRGIVSRQTILVHLFQTYDGIGFLKEPETQPANLDFPDPVASGKPTTCFKVHMRISAGCLRSRIVFQQIRWIIRAISSVSGSGYLIEIIQIGRNGIHCLRKGAIGHLSSFDSFLYDCTTADKNQEKYS